VTQKLLVLKAPAPKATLIVFPGGHGGLQLFPNGSMKWGENNFLVRSRQAVVDQGFTVLIVDAPSDRQSPPFLQGFRQRPEHAADIKAVIAWARESSKAPVWLIGTSRGTQSAAYLATELSSAEGPDGIVLTSSILVDDKGRPVPAMPLGKVRVPVLVVHHEQDGCALCPFALAPQIVDKLVNSPRKQLIAVTGGSSSGDACEGLAHHGFNGIEQSVVQQIAAWIVAI
jgi:pimeloyl-ACP methyl ester carboxylesterase